MREGFRRGVHAGFAAAALLLGSCGGKETGPSAEASPEVPDIATRPPPASADPELARTNLGFDGTDSDGDGRISSAEYAASSTRMFGSMDSDDDGGLTVPELDAARVAMRITGGPSSEKLIERADNDGDDKLTLAEFVADTNARFAAADTNADGYLTADEFFAGHPEIARERAAHRPAAASPATASAATRKPS